MSVDPNSINPNINLFESWNRKFQYVLDKSSPHPVFRWLFFLFCLMIYTLRVYLINGWYIVSYGLAIFLLNQFIGFLSPQVCLICIVLMSSF